MTDVFSKFPPFIQDYVYENGWTELREVQLGAAEILFGTDDNLLLTTATASGKTEAALFPVITSLWSDPPASFGALYIAPLKSLINDQFLRLSDVLDESGVKVFHWHGDVAQSHKTKALKEPSGILQITPESLESMLMNRPNDVVRLFGEIRYVIIDEIHTLTGSDRGNQIICQLARLSRLTGRDPVRIGLSATVGDAKKAADWLGAGSARHTSVVGTPDRKISWRLALEHFYIGGGDPDEQDAPPVDTDTGEVYMPSDKGYEYIYDATKGRKSLVFANSREETEIITATLRQIAERRGEPDVFRIHHGNLSAAIREEAELSLKSDEQMTVTCATVTLELGIDIGRLERIVQSEAPVSVSSLLQRLGRSGRRGAPPEMVMTFREENPLPNTPLPQLIPWSLIRGIALIQLYIEERFVEPPKTKKYPMSLMFHQTLSVLCSKGGLTPNRLAKEVLSLPPFSEVSPDDYRTLVLSMIKNDFIELTEDGTLIVGLKGERITSSFKFYAVFNDSEDFTVRSGSDEIGTITTPPPVGERFALAGRVWEVEELDISRHLIYVHPVDGKMEISWPGDYGEIHTKILERMKKVLSEDTVYPYLKKNARVRLDAARRVARNTGMLEKSIVHLGGYSWCVFPWLGTRSFRTLRRMIMSESSRFGITGMEYEGCYYMTFKMEKGNGRSLSEALKRTADLGIDRDGLIGASETAVFDKFDENIPAELLHRAYAADRLETVDVTRRIGEIYDEFH
ncbi:MAG: DEAD/DEAH box helicase [Clostridia bacterium]|nr:DEAD/DEAH box helicase [Clostridia bacterium]MBR5767938.1 DEAD/DEAH box helicase [Clostridia bacterium]